MSRTPPGERIELTVEKGVYRGLGLARHAGQVVFVPQGLPGERVAARVGQRTAGFLRASVEEVLEPSPQRRASPCPYVPRCGGCTYQALEYSAQVELKRAILLESLARAGVGFDGQVETHASPEQGWRTRATLHLQERRGTWLLGLHEEGSHRVVDLEHCLQLSPALNGTARAVLSALAEKPHWARRVTDIDLAESGDGSTRVACIHTEMDEREAVALHALASRVPLAGLAVVAGSRKRFLLLHGDPHLETSVLGVRLRSHVRSFFQGNRFLVEALARAVVGCVPANAPVLDLYCGVGLFTLPLAQGSRSVRGVELNPVSLADAQLNAEGAGLGHIRFERGDTAQALASWPRAEGEHVVLDPPRTGAGQAVVDAIVRREPAGVVYVSCDPPTLARDLRAFAGQGYRLEALGLFDMFPDTFHLEAVARLVRNER